MDKAVYLKIESYMLSCMEDSAHDAEHIYRVLGLANRLSRGVDEAVDSDVLTAACLLHDIGRAEQFKDPKVCHAEAGSKKAYAFLLELGWSEERAAHVRDCVLTHRFRNDRRPQTMEAKLLFDADKLDVSGAMGIARTLCYAGEMGYPLYTRDETGVLLEPTGDAPNTFVQEYRHKLEKIGGGLYTEEARNIAAQRLSAASAFYKSLLAEIRESLKS